MSASPRVTLYDLLPTIIRDRDVDVRDGIEVRPLHDLLAVIGEQADALHADIEQLYEDWFIETAQAWVVPYIGDLVGYQPVNPARPTDGDAARAHLRARVVSPRREIANTIRHRRRKGTLPLLEDIARDVADWPARAVESYRLLAWNQNLNHPHPRRGRTVDLRDMGAMARMGGAFERTAHTLDVRQISARPPLTQGRSNIPTVALFVWRLRSFPVTQAPARQVDRESGNCFTFSVLGNDAPLFTRVAPPRREMTIAAESEVPAPISRHALDGDIGAWYGRERSLFIEVVSDVGEDLQDPPPLARWQYTPIEASNVVVASLRGRDPLDPDAWPELTWPGPNAELQVMVDPEMGRLMFRPDIDPPAHVRVSYHHGFSAPIGGGEYPRPVRQPAGDRTLTYHVGVHERFNTIAGALAAWRAEPVAGLDAIVEITDNRVYTDPIAVALEPRQSLQIRAAVGNRPVIRVLDTAIDQREAISVSSRPAAGGAVNPSPPGPAGGQADARGGCLTLDGLLVEGRGLLVRGSVAELRIRHCTFVPGWSLDQRCRPRHSGEASLTIRSSRTCVTIEHSIVGPIEVGHDEVVNRAIPLRIRDSIVDATRADLPAIHRIRQGIAHATVDIRRSTVIGSVLAHAIEHGEDTIFLGGVTVARRQVGCLRFCWVPAGSRTPSRYHCQPDLAVESLPSDVAAMAAAAVAAAAVAPAFTSLRYGTPGYGQLLLSVAREIREGASDESEMGAFHDLYQPQRAANLVTRLAESVPAAMEAGIIFVT